MATSEKDVQEGMKRLEEHFGSRIGMLGFTLVMLSQTGNRSM